MEDTMNTARLSTHLIIALTLLSLVMLPLRDSTVPAQAQAASTTGTLAVTLTASDYTLRSENGQTHIAMQQDFGSFSAPGGPELPGRTFMIALPPGAQVTTVRFATP